MSVALQEINVRRRVSRLLFRSKVTVSLIASLVILLPVGCGGTRFIVLGSNPVPVNGSMTGNWQISATTTSGAQPFSSLTGSILQQAEQANGDISISAILQAQAPNTCYLGITTIPLEGSLTTASLSVTSLSVSGQYLDLVGTSSSAGDTLNGTFRINDGCANGVTGTVSGSRIAPLSGTYAGGWNSGLPDQGISLDLTQDAFSDGLGYFHLLGSASFTGVSCFTSGTLQDPSEISGQQITLTINTNETPASTISMSGTLDPAAKVLTITSIHVMSGSCSGGSGTATLSL